MTRVTMMEVSPFADMATAHATLMGLPNELLAIIVHGISTEDRLSLAHPCRRLNHVALSYQLYEKDIPYSSFGSYSRKFSDLRYLGFYLATEPPFPTIELDFTGQFELEMAQVQHYLDTIPYNPPAFHAPFLAGGLYSSFWRPDILRHFSSFSQSLVRWKYLSFVVPAFEAHELDGTVSFDVPALTTLQMATFNWPKSDRLAEWFVQYISASPIEVLSVLAPTDAFPSLRKVDILKKDFLWRRSQRQTEEIQAVLHLISCIMPSIRQLTAPLVDWKPP
ncbi:hypothetical protein F5146DRAFT_1005103 [Armillaria mellea]|nr:hypothetical protein F5146DRAFT_1005103 [Armillaria mellea]